MAVDRRVFLQSAGIGLAAAGYLGAQSAMAQTGKIKVGMCDWNLQDENGRGGTCRPELIPHAMKAHLQGLQVSVGTNPTSIPLRNPEFRSGQFNTSFVESHPELTNYSIKRKPEELALAIAAAIAAHAGL